MTKIQFYNSVISVYKKTGQGVPLFIKYKLPNPSVVDELISEGKLKVLTQHYSYLPNDETLCLTRGYCVEEDLSNLAFIRLYLNLDDLGLGLSSEKALKDFDFVVRYSEWLKSNVDKLLEMDSIELEDDIPETLSDSDIDFIKSREWYDENNKIEDILQIIRKTKENINEEKGLTKKVILLLNSRKSDDNIKKSSEYEKRLLEIDDEMALRNRIFNFLHQQDKTLRVQDIIK